MKNSGIMILVSAVCLVVGILLVGCQMPGKLVSEKKSSVCPTCKMETRTMAIKGMTYTKCICPSCQKVSTVDPQLAETVRNYVGDEIGDTVHVCGHCKAMVETCPVCRKQSDQ